MATVTLRILDGTDRGRSYDELLTPVTIGRDYGNSVEIVTGLTGDEQLIVNPPDSLENNAAVQIVGTAQ